MKNDGVMAYWIEAKTGQLCIEVLRPYHLLGGTYETEVYTKYANDPVEVVIIELKSAGNEWEKSEVARLKQRAEEIRTALAAAQSS